VPNLHKFVKTAGAGSGAVSEVRNDSGVVMELKKRTTFQKSARHQIKKVIM
jgi:tRNA A58 N-methylase Trm61